MTNVLKAKGSLKAFYPNEVSVSLEVEQGVSFNLNNNNNNNNNAKEKKYQKSENSKKVIGEFNNKKTVQFIIIKLLVYHYSF